MGTSTAAASIAGDVEDHPHACGDKARVEELSFPFTGSSPRVWGQVCSFIYCLTMPGIIPTRVGTSYFESKGKLNSWDHPHACGDKEKIRRGVYDNTGSSPRVWGQEIFNSVVGSVARIIPTRVGTSPPPLSSSVAVWDHPHACGDKLHISV